MDRLVGVERVEVGEEFFLRDRLREELERSLHADFGGGLLLLGDVGDRCGVIADADEGHVGHDRGEPGHAFLDFGEDLLGDGVSVDEAHGGGLRRPPRRGREKSFGPPSDDCLALRGKSLKG